MMKNFITFDLENWYDSEFVKYHWNEGDLILEGLSKVTKLLNKYKIKATFFVTGKILEKYSHQIKRLFEQGHEISSHSYEHKMLNKMPRKEIENSLSKSKMLIRKITGKNPLGFRAPCCSISKKQFWVYKTLKNLGFSYSSSLFPVNMGLYGDSSFPLDPFCPLKDERFLEIPIRPLKIFNVRIPFSGGIYFRILPRQILSSIFKRVNRQKKRVVLYLHPWEFCLNIPRVKTSVIGKVQIYWGIKWNFSKLEYMLKRFSFDSIENILKKENLC